MKSPSRLLWVAVTVASIVLGSGCSSFRRDLKASRQRDIPHDSVEGLWVGDWSSVRNPDHGGRMEMVLTRTGDTLYRASTRSHWWRLFRSSYDTTIVVTPIHPGGYLILGEKNLWGFGGYTLTGRVDSAAIDAGFRVGSNEGRIRLGRPAEDGERQ